LNWFRTSTGVETLANTYQKRLTPLALRQLPDVPRFILCATDMAYGVNWVFERARMGDYQAGYMEPPVTWPLGRAVAASSCFPPVFNPLPTRFDSATLTGGKAPPGPERDACLSDLRLTDGGNYDNMGLEPVWKDHAVVLVSDGGATFDQAPTEACSGANRYVGIQGNQAAAVRKRWLIAGFIDGVMEGTYWVASALRVTTRLRLVSLRRR
jgi:NTE family protein